jgi:type IX secretion system PorP/SprF family membrane protein
MQRIDFVKILYTMQPLKSVFILTLILFTCIDLKAQDPELTQFYASPIYTNPAFAGTGSCFGGGRVSLNYRNQWPSLPGSFVTTALSYDQHFDKIGGGVGVMLVDDRAGDGRLKSTSVSAVYSYQLRISRKFEMRFGMQGEFGSRSIDWQRLRFEDQINPQLGFVEPTGEIFNYEPNNYANFSAGLVGYTKNFYAGFAAHNIIEPNISFWDNEDGIVPVRFTAHGGTIIPLDGRRVPETTLSPNVLFMMQEKFVQVNLGFYLNHGPLVTGLWFRQTGSNSDALIALVGFKKEKFRFGYSYDITVSGANAAAPGSHEISVGIDWCAKQRSKTYKNIPCPRI